MPTEFEFKYVVSPDFLGRYTDDNLRALCDEVSHIKQGYLAFSRGMSCRVRCSTEHGKDRWTLTFKQKVAKRTIEVEKKLDVRDGGDLWAVAVGKLTKDRHVFHHGGVNWELDLFRSDSETYFVMAEVELSENSPRPDSVLPIIRPYLLYEVPLGDDRFSSKRLGDVKYARQLYAELAVKSS